jgi:hypothetical protein
VQPSSRRRRIGRSSQARQLHWLKQMDKEAAQGLALPQLIALHTFYQKNYSIPNAFFYLACSSSNLQYLRTSQIIIAMVEGSRFVIAALRSANSFKQTRTSRQLLLNKFFSLIDTLPSPQALQPQQN